MEALLEFIIAIFVFVLGITVHAIVAVAFPVRFLLSDSYRKKKREQWAASRVRHVVDIAGGTFAVLLFSAVAVLWFGVLWPPSKPAAKPERVSTLPAASDDITITVTIDGEKAKKAISSFIEKLKDKDRSQQPEGEAPQTSAPSADP